MLNLKQDNERLQRIVTSKSLTSSQNSLPLNEAERRFSMGDAIISGRLTHWGLSVVVQSFYLGTEFTLAIVSILLIQI